MKALFAALALLTTSSAFAGQCSPDSLQAVLTDLQNTKQQLAYSQQALDHATSVIFQMMNASSGVVTCRGHGHTSFWDGEYVGTGPDEQTARDELVKDCFRKYPGPKDVVCPNWRGASDVVCTR
jgi:hypothetical protein